MADEAIQQGHKVVFGEEPIKPSVRMLLSQSRLLGPRQCCDRWHDRVSSALERRSLPGNLPVDGVRRRYADHAGDQTGAEIEPRPRLGGANES
jgi:hypothetical protein